MNKKNLLNIIQPDDWHVHLREGDMMRAVSNYSSRVNKRCIVMPNLEIPITLQDQANKYKNEILNATKGSNFIPLIPCYLTNDLNLRDFKDGLLNDTFVGAKLYPSNATTNSSFGISKIINIYPALEILEELDKPLLIHGEKVRDNIDIFDREKYFIDEELVIIREKFPNLRIILEHISSKYGADYVNDNKNIAGTITPQHMMLTKKDVFFKDFINPHHFCMPVVKDENDLIALRKYACSGNDKFFLVTDSAPHHIDTKKPILPSKAGIFSALCSIEIYATIFDEEHSIENLEKFSSINGPNFYKLSINSSKLDLIKESWIIPEFIKFNNITVKNFMAGKKINWKIQQ